MKAMILAAGLGTRLRPLTNDRPKALVEIDGHTLLEITLRRLRHFGVQEVIINAHHFGEMMINYLHEHDDFGMKIQISQEDLLLDTGGGLKKAAHFFLSNSGDAAEPFLLHNVDVISTIDLARMLQFHVEQDALATLAVQERRTSRYLLFDDRLQLCGRKIISESEKSMVDVAIPVEHQVQPLSELAFCGVHVISPRLLSMITEAGIFSIIETYLRLAAQGETILGFRADEYYWRDLGKPENFAQVAEDLKAGLIAS
jgi:NDP-sugar pyrophosphorylase family protein